MKAENFQLLFNICSVTFFQTLNSCVSDLTQTDVFRRLRFVQNKYQNKVVANTRLVTSRPLKNRVLRKSFMLDK